MEVFVNNEVGKLKRLIIHSPDSGLGKVVPSKAQDWLFEDIVHLQTMRKNEYDNYARLLLYFLDPEKIANKPLAKIGAANRNFFIPGKTEYFNSDKVLEFECLLNDVLQEKDLRIQLISAVSAIEECSYQEMRHFMKMSVDELTNTLITGITYSGEMFFPPIPNLIFTRDIGIVVNDYLLLNKPAKLARSRESLLAKYVFFNHPVFAELNDRIIEIEENEEHFLLPEEEQFARQETLEGGDVMMVAPKHLLIGISERTSLEAARQAMRKLFAHKVVEKVTMIKIPAKRDYMHIDTIFTQIKRNVWVLLGSLGRAAERQRKEKIWEALGQKENVEELVIKQFYIEQGKEKSRSFENLEDLLTDISKHDLQVEEETVFIYSGNGEFPYGAREQWTDSCNLLVLKEGVAIGYDRNDKTSEAFEEAGFKIKLATELIKDFEAGHIKAEDVEDTIILLPSAELSRARGGSHCMSLPILRQVF
ncbi:arginine deiminase family protein [Marinilongibacter aquaticus]|uniref:arginine deiminase family protein n=1 Tax=Marinilongibacter aquaticus TaxID=2975157 RepID=UPI00286E1191|nr:arginine deiminase family protein [Marinilongibacter aquaticus]